MESRNTAIRPVLLGLALVVVLTALWAAGCSSETPAPIATAVPTQSPSVVLVTKLPAATYVLTAWPTTSQQQPTPVIVTVTPGIDPRFQTATAVVAGATATAMVYTPIPLPTLSNQETDHLRQRWLTQLEATAGFSHPALDDAVDKMVQAASSVMEHSTTDFGPQDRFRNVELSMEVESTTFDGDTYKVVIVTYDRLYASHQLLMFRISNGNVEEIPISVITTPIGNFLGFDDRHWGLDGFTDRNGNGYPDLAIHSSGGQYLMILLEIQPDGTVVDISPVISSDDKVTTYLVDLELDGVLEFLAAQHAINPQGVCPVQPCGLIRYYGWNGTAYVDITSSLDIAYWPEIGAFWDRVSDQNGCLLPDYSMYAMLMAYEARDELPEGWVLLEPALRWDECSAEQIEQHGEDMDNLLEWLGARLGDSDQAE